MIYLDSSAALKALVAEPESPALIAWLAGAGEDLAASWLVHTELHCAAARRPEVVELAQVEHLLSAVALVDVTRSDLLTAPALGHGLRTLDAVHLATALRLTASGIATYHRELASAARAAGLAVHSPGAQTGG